MIELPWPSKDLSPNGRLHYMTVATAKRKAREHAGWVAKANKKTFHPDINIPISLIFFPPDKRNYDLDGLLSRSKAMLDGLADGWGVNDKLFRPITIDMGEVVKHGKVQIFI